MHDSMAMRIVERAGDLCRRLSGADRCNRARFLNEVGQRATLEIRHDGVHYVVRRAVIENAADVRMHELGRGFRLASKSLGHLDVAREMRVQNLDDDRPRELRLLRDVNVGHAAAAHALEYTIPITDGATQARDLVVRPLERPAIEHGKRLGAARADGGRCPVPGTTLRAEHRSGSELHLHEVVRSPGSGHVEAQEMMGIALFLQRGHEPGPEIPLDEK